MGPTTLFNILIATSLSSHAFLTHLLNTSFEGTGSLLNGITDMDPASAVSSVERNRMQLLLLVRLVRSVPYPFLSVN